VLALRGELAVTWKKTAVLASALAVGILAIGYASAWFSLSSCAEDVFQDTQRRNDAGTDLQGNRIEPSHGNISANIVGPFLVEVSYTLPRDLHGSVYYARYVVFFGYRYQRTSDVIHLVSTQPRETGLSANNSFKPNPLRGSA
jgi:hypothetical protein